MTICNFEIKNSGPPLMILDIAKNISFNKIQNFYDDL